VQFHTGLAITEELEGPAEIDYRLQRRRLLDEIERGVVDRDEVCDIHPELLRAARNVAPAIDEPCPLCQENRLRIVAYVFGPRLGPGGKCVISDEELQKIARRRGKFFSYEVEVCVGCGWNHLRRRYPL